MNILRGLKIGVLGAFLLAIFSLPALTATQLVSVLGTKTIATQLVLTPTGDSNTFLKQVGTTFTISFLKPGTHHVLQVTNPSPSPRSLNLQLGTLSSASAGNVSVNLINGSAKYLMFQKSAVPTRSNYILTIPANQTIQLNLDVTTADNAVFGTFTLTATEF